MYGRLYIHNYLNATLYIGRIMYLWSIICNNVSWSKFAIPLILPYFNTSYHCLLDIMRFITSFEDFFVDKIALKVIYSIIDSKCQVLQSLIYLSSIVISLVYIFVSLL